MARTKPKPRIVQTKSGNTADFYNNISVGDILFLYGDFATPAIPSKFLVEIDVFVSGPQRFYLANVTKEVYEYIKNQTLTDDLIYVNGFQVVGAEQGYIGVLKNARFVEFRTDTGSGGTPAPGSLTATEGDGIVILHKSATTNLTGSVDSNNWETFVWPATGRQSFFLQRNGGSAGSFTPPSLTPATQSGSWVLQTFYFESATEN